MAYYPYAADYNPYLPYPNPYFLAAYGGYDYAQDITQRPRSPTPPPIPAEPSPDYLAVSLSSTMPPGQRKLVIFDLNGTLLLRSPRNRGTRQIYLRPYARALVDYLAHPNVRTWLDCMVWSSAQPHNVREMVDRVFGAGEGAGKGPILRAVWARDTLGLSREAFHQKSQTTKDLAKPWAFFASDAPHGPQTTLLIDDSPLKARLQPYNHLCVAEYDASTRARDRAAVGLPPDSHPDAFTDPPPGDPEPEQLNENSVSGGTGSSNPHAKPKPNSLRAELAALAEEASAALTAPDALSSLPPKDRWRKRRRLEADPAAHAEGADEPEPPNAQVQNPSKRALRKQRKRLREAGGLGPEIAQQQSGGVQQQLEEGSSWPPARGPEGEDDGAADTDTDARRTETAAQVADADEVGGAAAAPPDASSSESGGLGLEIAQQQFGGVHQQPEKGLSSSPAWGPEEEDDGAADTDPDARRTETEPQVAHADEVGGVAAAPPDASSSPIPVSVLSSPISPTAADSPKRKRKRGLSEGGDPRTAEPDPTLLAVLGVFAHVRDVGNVAAWVRGGGLRDAVHVPVRGHVRGSSSAAYSPSVPVASLEEEDEEAEKDEDVEGEEEGKVEPDPDPDPDPARWFASPRLLRAWAARGRVALQELGIEAVSGVE